MESRTAISAALDDSVTTLLFREHASPHRIGLVFVRDGVVDGIAIELVPIFDEVDGDIRKLYERGSIMTLNKDLIQLVQQSMTGSYKGAPLKVPFLKLNSDSSSHVVSKR